MKHPRHSGERGGISGNLIAIILLILAILLLAALSVWLYLQYNDQKTYVDTRVLRAVNEAKKEQKTQLQQEFLEKEKQPYQQFVGPDDYGRLTFSYPKTWSAYVESDASDGGNFEAYLHPATVPPVDAGDERYALRVLIEDEGYDQVVANYDSLVEDGDLRSSATSANGVAGTRFDGAFSDDIRGAAVVYKVRDKTVSIFTDANTFKPDFEKLIKTIKFNQ